jgi:hypothetical protein
MFGFAFAISSNRLLFDAILGTNNFNGQVVFVFNASRVSRIILSLLSQKPKSRIVLKKIIFFLCHSFVAVLFVKTKKQSAFFFF